MTFNSLTFVFFLTVVLTAYYRLGHRGQNLLLLLASYVFYSWWDWRFLSLLLFSTFFDCWCALWIERHRSPAARKLFLAFSMFVNLGVLGVFKYYDFFADSLGHILTAFGMKATFPILHVILPVGISFYTFLSMSYTIDVYRRELQAARSLPDYMLYVAFFPHLVAGPIVRASYLLPQCQQPRVINPAEVANGIWLILLGYVKKVVIADRLAGLANWGFSQPGPPFSDANAWLVLYAFAFQIYGDFSGYTDIARGVSKLMGFELITNFRAPYLVTNPSLFWQHWNISLSTWLRDYLYIPLGGNRCGRVRNYSNLMITMLLGGLWHGAGFAYLLWGLYQGTILAIHRVWHDVTGFGLGHVKSQENVNSSAVTVDSAKNRAPRPETRDLVGAPPPASRHAWKAGFKLAIPKICLHAFVVVIFFHLTCVGWLLFRAGSVPRHFDQIQVVLGYLHAMFRCPTHVSPLVQPVVVLGGFAMFFQWRYAEMDSFSTWKPHWQAVAVVLALAAITALGVFDGAQFVYFQF